MIESGRSGSLLTSMALEFAFCLFGVDTDEGMNLFRYIYSIYIGYIISCGTFAWSCSDSSKSYGQQEEDVAERLKLDLIPYRTP